MDKSLDQLFFSKREQAKSFAYFFQKNSARENIDFDGPEIPSFREFCNNLSSFQQPMFNAIQKGEFEFQLTRRIPIFADKKRVIIKFSWPDKFITTHFAKCIEKVVSKHYPDSLYSYRAGRSNLKALQYVSKFLSAQTTPVYLLRRDIKSYAEEMKHDWVMKDFEHFTSPSAPLRRLMQQVCAFPYEEDGSILTNQCGVPTGSYHMLIAGNLYLIEMDRIMETYSDSLYLRFCDDILFLTRSREVFESAKATMEREVNSRGIRFKEEKSSNCLVVPPHLNSSNQMIDSEVLTVASHFKYLGMNLDYRGVLSLPREKQRRMTTFLGRRLKQINSIMPPTSSVKTRVRALSKAVREIYSDSRWFKYSTGLDYLRDITDESQLRELDRWTALCVSGLALQSGFKRGNFAKLPYQELRALGLPSLVHLRHCNEL